MTFTERGLWFPTGIAIAFTLMVLWNFAFIYIALATAPEVQPDYETAIHR